MLLLNEALLHKSRERVVFDWHLEQDRRKMLALCSGSLTPVERAHRLQWT
jgi:hypothetical protein